MIEYVTYVNKANAKAIQIIEGELKNKAIEYSAIDTKDRVLFKASFYSHSDKKLFANAILYKGINLEHSS